MAINRKAPYLICYDIANPKRLQRLHRKVSAVAVMIQYSVYFAELNQREVDLIIGEIQECILSGEDDVRLYPLPRDAQLDMLGVQVPLCLPVSESGIRITGLAGGRLN